MTLQKSARGLTIATGGDSDDDTSHYENPVKLSVTAKQAPAPVVMKAAVLDVIVYVDRLFVEVPVVVQVIFHCLKFVHLSIRVIL